ncbi:MAG TPA: ATP-binding protein [Candidatus Dormibacteraeota bacterium]|jgi:anti-sigma regulatory factor (Ser/Thr protein kinase)|nr:ATP-binding protein [Candidatus Dormibacteraeota bacterium]
MEPSSLAELRIPADFGFISLARRVASTLGSQLGFTLEGLDELNIAVAEACGCAIAEAQQAWGGGELKLAFSTAQGGLAVDVEGLPPSQTQIRRLAPQPRPAARDEEMRRLADEVIRCFVDDFRPSIEPGVGRLRFRMVKYLIG